MNNSGLGLPCGCKVYAESVIEYDPISYWDRGMQTFVGRTLRENKIDIHISVLCDNHTKDNIIESFWGLYNDYVKIQKIFKDRDLRFTNLHIYMGKYFLPNGLSD